jgi:hypothetical protein
MIYWYVYRRQDTNIPFATCLDPPSGFSDGHELSEAECDMDTIHRLKRPFKPCENNCPSYGEQEYSHKNFTIAVWQENKFSSLLFQVYEEESKLLLEGLQNVKFSSVHLHLQEISLSLFQGGKYIFWVIWLYELYGCKFLNIPKDLK